MATDYSTKVSQNYEGKNIAIFALTLLLYVLCRYFYTLEKQKPWTIFFEQRVLCLGSGT